MNEQVAQLSGAGNAGDGFEALTRINDGFLGTGNSAAVELSLIVMALIVLYVAVGFARYYLSGSAIMAKIAEALGLRDAPASLRTRR